MRPLLLNLAAALALSAAMLLATGCSLLDFLGKGDVVPIGAANSTGLVIADCCVLYGDKPLFAFLGNDPDAVITGGIIMNEQGDQYLGTALGPGDGEGLLLFPSIPPGNYRLWKIESSYYLDHDEKKKYYNWDPEGVFGCPDELVFAHVLLRDFNDHIVFSVEPGKFVYFGKIVIEEEHDAGFGSREVIKRPPIQSPTGGWEIDRHACHFKKGQWELLTRDQHQIEALENLIKRYGSNPWRAQWRLRLEELEAGSNR